MAPNRNRPRRSSGGIAQLPFRVPRNLYPSFAVMSADEIEAIHRASLKILAEIGMEVLHDESRRILRMAGAAIDEGNLRVRLDPAFVEEKIALVPPRFSLRARSSRHDLSFGDHHVVFAATGGPAFANDLERGRRPGNFADMLDFLKLVQSLNIVHQEGGCPIEPTDLPAETRHLDFYRAVIELTDKTWQCWGLGAYRVEDALAMLEIVFGCDRAGLRRQPATLTIINSNSPLRLDIPMGEGLIAMAQAYQPVAVTPFTLAGAMSPVTIAGALVQQNAEALFMMALAQTAAPGAPLLYGGFTSNVDMRSGAPAFGTPEYAKAQIASGQLARRYNLPFRSSNVTAANGVDVQAAYESGMSLWSTILGGAGLIEHAAGWLEGGLTASFEKLIVDAEMLQLMSAFLEPIPCGEAELALGTIAEVGPGGHFFGVRHTLDRFEHAFYKPLLSDWRNYESWAEAGAKNGTERAHGIVRDLLAAYEKPPLDPAIGEALDAYVAKRKEELGA